MAYVYRHIRLDKNEVFYIGIGNTRYRHQAIQNRSIIWKRIIAKTEWVVEILFDDVTWEFACQKEIEFIKLYGRVDRGTGTLANMTDGGDGNLGLKHSEDGLRRISESSKNRVGYWKGKKQPIEAVKKGADARRGKPNKSRGVKKNWSEEMRQKARNRVLGNKYSLGRIMSEETKRKISESNKGKVAYNKGKVGLIGELNGMYGKKHTEESKRKNREAQNRKPVSQYNFDGVLVDTFQSLAEAGRKTGFCSTGIQSVCKGRHSSYKNFIWRYE